MTETDGLGLYVHWPFCVAKCPYCDFNSHVAEAVDQARWRAALVRELGHYATETKGRTVTSIYFGGGTPSLMDPAAVAGVLDAVAGRWALADDAEITLEANPGSADAGRFAGYRSAGVNRLSLGVQSLDDGALAFLGRIHGAAEARAAIDLATRTFPRLSFDLIYGLPGQTPATWRAELTEAAALAGDHLSCYQLTVEPGTPFHARGVAEAGEDRGAALYETTATVLDAAGLTAYEVANHARPGGACRHNLAVWRGGDYVGVGPGAHGRVSGADGTVATRNRRRPDAWLAAVEAQGHGTADRTPLSAEERRDELVMMGLRLTEGLEAERFQRRAGMPLEEAVRASAVDDLVAGGFLVRDGRGIRATAAGRLRLDAVTGALLVRPCG